MNEHIKNEYINAIVKSAAEHIMQNFCTDMPLSKYEILEICILLNFELLKKNGCIDG